MSTLSKAWLSYDLQVLPPNAPDVQRVETRRAFYAGAQALMGLLHEIGDSSAPDEQDATRLEAVDQELRAFVRDLAGGRA